LGGFVKFLLLNLFVRFSGFSGRFFGIFERGDGDGRDVSML